MRHAAKGYEAPLVEGFSNMGRSAGDDELQYMDLEDDPNADPYELFDFDITADKHSLKTKGRQQGGEDVPEGAALPVASSWINSNVTVPNRIALATMISIIIYEVLVVVSMVVASLRTLMANGLMYFLLIINVALLLTLGGLVYKSKRQFNVSAITKRLKGSKRVEEEVDGDRHFDDGDEMESV